MVLNILSMVFVLFSGIVSAKLLGPTGRGELAAVQSWSIFLGIISVAGVQEALTYYIAKEGDKEGEFFASATCLATVISIPIIVIGWISIPFLLKEYSVGIVHAAQMNLFLLVIQSTVMMSLSIFRGIGDFTTWSILKFLTSFLWATMLFILWIADYKNPARISYLYFTIPFIVGIVGLLLLITKKRLVLRPHLSQARSLSIYASKSVFGAIPSTVNVRLDQLVMTSFIGGHSLGLYTAAVSWSVVIIPLINSLASIVMPNIAASKNVKEVEQSILKFVSLGLIFCVLLALSAGCLAPIAIPYIFGESFRPGISSAVILSIAAGIMGLNQLLEACLLGLGRPQAVFKAEIVGALVTIILLWKLLPVLGIIGAAITSVISYIVITGVLVYLLSNIIKIKMYKLLVIDFEYLKSLKVQGYGKIKEYFTLL